VRCYEFVRVSCKLKLTIGQTYDRTKVAIEPEWRINHSEELAYSRSDIVVFTKQQKLEIELKVSTLNNKGLALVNLNNYIQAIQYYDKALDT
jgi:tetratricopeptide (TPR) repeat protein